MRKSNIDKKKPENGIQPEVDAQRLKDYFYGYDHGLVAFSGGVDSALLAFSAHRVLGKNMMAVLADSPEATYRRRRLSPT